MFLIGCMFLLTRVSDSAPPIACLFIYFENILLNFFHFCCGLGKQVEQSIRTVVFSLSWGDQGALVLLSFGAIFAQSVSLLILCTNQLVEL